MALICRTPKVYPSLTLAKVRECLSPTRTVTVRSLTNCGRIYECDKGKDSSPYGLIARSQLDRSGAQRLTESWTVRISFCVWSLQASWLRISAGELRSPNLIELM